MEFRRGKEDTFKNRKEKAQIRKKKTEGRKKILSGRNGNNEEYNGEI